MNQQQQQTDPTQTGTQTGTQDTQSTAVTPAPLATVPAGGLTKRVARILPSFGTARQNDAQLYAGPINGTAQTVGTITLPLQTAGLSLFSPPIGAGIIRVKVYNTTTAVTAVNVTLYDSPTAAASGNSELVAGFSGSLTATATGSSNILIHFQSDLNVTSMTVAIVGGTGGSADIDVGATSA